MKIIGPAAEFVKAGSKAAAAVKTTGRGVVEQHRSGFDAA
jgi:hypothetical protein